MAFKVRQIMQTVQMLRSFSARRSGNLFSSSLSSAREIAIPVPWGHIAVKEWGPPNGIPVLGIHGWLDNAGTFDTLAPLLPEHVRLVCLEFSGHGLSSHRPFGSNYRGYEFLGDVHRVVQFLKLQKFSIIAHSMGARIAAAYAGLFPSEVVKMAWIDNFHFLIATPEEQLKHSYNFIDTTLQYEASLKSPSIYTQQEALNLTLQKYLGSLTEDSAKILLKRGTRPQNGGVCFTHDPRVKHSGRLFFSGSSELEEAFLKNICCELLVMICKNPSVFNFRDPDRKYINVNPSQCKTFKMVEIEGTHHFHLNEPEKAEPYLTELFS